MPQNLCRCGPQVLGAANRAVYCSGPLLDAVQRSKMFPDCKTFVDMKSKYPPERMLGDYELFRNCRKNDGSFQFLQMFVEKHFLEKGTELEEWTPPDWKSEPPFANRIADPELRKFGVELNALWKVLGRRMKDEVKESPEKYSIVYVPNPVIVPGGRFIEFYYWDSLWIIRGLLHCGMHDTARGMIDNFLSIVRQYGFVPNGGRVYYYGRSQPPMLIHMMKAYVDVTLDEKYAIQSLPQLESEFNNFLEKHQVQVKGRTMYHYQDYSTGPRPESYREDVASAAEFLSEPEKERHYTQLKSACESGMDFSSRWFIARDGSNRGTLKDIQTTSIVPVDLNVILFRSAKILAEFNRKAGNASKVEEYSDIACGLVKAVRDVLWNDEAGIWLDYDMLNNRPRPYFSASNFSPLWARAYPLVDTEKISRGVMNYIKSNNLDDFPGGVPNTMNKETGQQWDYPNVWPPMMFMIIDGLNNLATPEARAMSERWAHRWVKNNYEAYNKTGYMFEKYNCEKFGFGGGGGEYQNQTGFGWTNGIILEYLSRYGPDLSLDDSSDAHCTCRAGKVNGNLGDCPVTSESKIVTKKNYIVTSEDNMDAHNSPLYSSGHSPPHSPAHSPDHCPSTCMQNAVGEASNMMKQSLVANIVGHPVVASPKRATNRALGRSTNPKSGHSTITSFPQLRDTSTGEYTASVAPRDQASAIPFKREQAISPTGSPGRSPVPSQPESRLPTFVENRADPYSREQSAAITSPGRSMIPSQRESSIPNPVEYASSPERYCREQSAVAAHNRDQPSPIRSPTLTVDNHNNPLLILTVENNNNNNVILNQRQSRSPSSPSPVPREQASALPSTGQFPIHSEHESSIVEYTASNDPYSQEQSAGDPYSREQFAADPYNREQSAVEPYGREQFAAVPYNREQSAVDPYNQDRSAADPYSREQSAVDPYNREQSAADPYSREQSAVDPYNREQSAADPYSREQSAVDPYNREPSAADPYSREKSSADAKNRGKFAPDPYSRVKSAVDPYHQSKSAADPYSREQSAADPYNRERSAIDPYGREQSAVDPYSREQSAVDPYSREQSAVDPYSREQSAVDPYSREQSAVDPYSREQSAVDPYSRQQSAVDPYIQEQATADPQYPRCLQCLGLPTRNTQPQYRIMAAVPFTAAAVPYNAPVESSSTVPYNGEQSATEPYNQEQTAADQRGTRFTSSHRYAPSAVPLSTIVAPCGCNAVDSGHNSESRQYIPDPVNTLAPRIIRSQSGYDGADPEDLPEGCSICPHCGGIQQAPTVDCKATNQPSEASVPVRPVHQTDSDCGCSSPTSVSRVPVGAVAPVAPVEATDSDCECAPPTSSTKLPAIKQFPLADQKGTDCPEEVNQGEQGEQGKPVEKMCCGCPIYPPPK